MIANSFYSWLTSDCPQNDTHFQYFSQIFVFLCEIFEILETWLQFGVMIYESWILISLELKFLKPRKIQSIYFLKIKTVFNLFSLTMVQKITQWWITTPLTNYSFFDIILLIKSTKALLFTINGFSPPKYNSLEIKTSY